MNTLNNSQTLTAFDNIGDLIHYGYDNPNLESVKYRTKKRCNNNFFKYLFLSPIIFSLLLLLLSSIYTNIMLQLFLLNVNSKIDHYDFKKMAELYYNVSHNTYIMCTLVTNPASCYIA